MDFVFFVQCEKGSVKHVMNFPHFEKAELICDRREDCDDSEESFSFWSELWVGDGAFEVSGF